MNSMDQIYRISCLIRIGRFAERDCQPSMLAALTAHHRATPSCRCQHPRFMPQLCVTDGRQRYTPRAAHQRT
jgi:hypothetical protein